MKRHLLFIFLCCLMLAPAARAQTHDIGGHIIKPDASIAPTFAGYKVWLIAEDTATGDMAIADSLVLDSTLSTTTDSVYYRFSNVSLTKAYRVWAEITNDSGQALGYAPTYHDSALKWQDATGFFWSGDADTLSHDITMQACTDTTTGPGLIAGHMLGQGWSPIPYAHAYLYDTSGNLIRHIRADQYGRFAFFKLPYGHYRAFPEEAGYTVESQVLEIDSRTWYITNFAFMRRSAEKKYVQVWTGVEDVPSAAAFAIYPNPAKGALRLRMAAGGKAALHIADMAGRTVYSGTVTFTNGETTAPVNLNTGIYTITLAKDGRSTSQKLVVE